MKFDTLITKNTFILYLYYMNTSYNQIQFYIKRTKLIVEQNQRTLKTLFGLMDPVFNMFNSNLDN